MVFSVTTDEAAAGVYSVNAIAQSGGRNYQAGWRSVGYQGLRPYNQYLPAELKTRKVDVKLAPGLRIGYVMGPGDMVPEAIEELGVQPHVLERRGARFRGSFARGMFWSSAFAPIPRALSWRLSSRSSTSSCARGGTLIVQYQSDNLPRPAAARH